MRDDISTLINEQLINQQALNKTKQWQQDFDKETIASKNFEQEKPDLNDKKKFPILSLEQEQEYASGMQDSIEALVDIFNHISTTNYFLKHLLNLANHSPSSIKVIDQHPQNRLIRREIDIIKAQKKSDIEEIKWSGPLIVAIASLYAREDFAYNELASAIYYLLAKTLSDQTLLNQQGYLQAHKNEYNDKQMHAIKQHAKNYITARNHLIAGNIRLVYHITLKQHRKSPFFEELIHEGYLGLSRAAEKYELSSGFRFSTYAFNWIKASIDRALDHHKSVIQYPSHILLEIKRLYKIRLEFIKKHNRSANNEELAILMEVDVERINYLLNLCDITLSLDSPIGNEDEDESFLSRIPSQDFAPDKLHQDEQLKEKIKTLLLQLPEREASILAYRYGLYDGEARNLSEISEAIGLSRERVRQLEMKALNTLREIKNEDMLCGELSSFYNM